MRLNIGKYFICLMLYLHGTKRDNMFKYKRSRSNSSGVRRTKRSRPSIARRNKQRPARTVRRVRTGSMLSYEFRPEMKTHATLYNESSVSTLSGFLATYLNAVAEGSTESTRNGNKIFGKGYNLKINLVNNEPMTPVYVRMAVIAYPEQTAGTPNVGSTGLLCAPSGELTYNITSAKSVREMQSIMLPVNKFNKEIKWLWHKVVKLEAQGNRGSSQYISQYVPLNKRIQYVASTSNATCTWASYFIMWTARGDNDTSTGATVEVSGYSKYTWHDV